MSKLIHIGLVPLFILIGGRNCQAQSFYMRCEREKTCLGNDSCSPQGGIRLFFINAANKSVFDYISGMSTYWTKIDSWSSSQREPVSNSPATTFIRKQYGNSLVNQDLTIYTPPPFSTSAKIDFGDAYDWTSSFERERPHKFRYSYAIHLTEYSYEKGQGAINVEYGYCNMDRK